MSQLALAEKTTARRVWLHINSAPRNGLILIKIQDGGVHWPVVARYSGENRCFMTPMILGQVPQPVHGLEWAPLPAYDAVVED